jgi:hypothetical protein
MMAEQESNQFTYYCTFNTLFRAGCIESSIEQLNTHPLSELFQDNQVHPATLSFRVLQSAICNISISLSQLLTSLSWAGVSYQRSDR